MKHAFYADSGGYFLHSPDFKPIPVNAKQLLYLIDHEYVDYPTLSEQDIDDKNKVDILLRAISIGQILWFSATVIARRAQDLIITGMELTTAAFIFCSLGTTYCWWDKGADVGVPAVMNTTATMVKILQDAGDVATGPYHRTPLDFVSREEWHWSLYWTHWINILRKMHIVFAPRALPHDRIENTLWLDPGTLGSWGAFIFMTLVYSSIFIAGWNSYFPTAAERTLWRISSLLMTSTIFFYFFITAFAYIFYPALQRYFQPQAAPSPRSQSTKMSPQLTSTKESKLGLETLKPINELPRHLLQKARSRLSLIAARLRNNSISKDPSLDVPLKATLPMYVVGFIYCFSRTSILILDMIQLRSLPPSAFATVNWSAFIPHLT
jgi:hypothetical protein